MQGDDDAQRIHSSGLPHSCVRSGLAKRLKVLNAIHMLHSEWVLWYKIKILTIMVSKGKTLTS